MSKPEKRFDQEDFRDDVHYMAKDLITQWANPDHSDGQVEELSRRAFKVAERYLESAIRLGYKDYMRESYGKNDDLFIDEPEPEVFGDDVGDDSEKLNESIKKIVEEDKAENIIDEIESERDSYDDDSN